METAETGLRFVVLMLLFGWSSGCFPGTIVYPIRYADRSIDLGISADELNVPTGKCADTTSNDLSLILPRSCAPHRLYSGFVASDRVTCLSLRDNLIERVSIGSFDHLPNLRYLDLSKNRIEFCDLLSFGGNDRLTTLIVDENGTPGEGDGGLMIDRSSYFPRVEHLYLRGNRLRQLRFSLRRNFPSLTHFYLSDNLLGSESIDALELPISLRHLHLERNRIRRLQSRTVRDLHFLFLDGNEIGTVCATNCRGSFVDLRGATKLRFLSLTRNEIAHIDRDSFVDACNLRSLSLSHNRIESIAHGTFDWLRELWDLSLSHNRLRRVPSFNFARKLASLTLDHNEIERIESGAFGALTRLKWISLSGNRIRAIETGAFCNLEMLEELDLSDNELSYLAPAWIGSNTRLRLLDLRGNRFTSFDHLYLYDVVSLTDLYMQGNPLSSLAPPPFGTFSRNVNLHTEYGMTFSPRPCYVICNFDSHALSRSTQITDYWI